MLLALPSATARTVNSKMRGIKMLKHIQIPIKMRKIKAFWRSLLRLYNIAFLSMA